MLDWMVCDLKQCVEDGFPCDEVLRSGRKAEGER